MKQIINGRKYDTSTAEKIMSYSNNGNWGDFRHFEEALYRKKTGEFFLFGTGGPNTKYAEPVGQRSWTGGTKIIPLDICEAKKWVEEHMDADDYEEIFGEVEE